MIEDGELVKQLNLLHASPTFVFRENALTGAIELKVKTEVPESDGIYWIAGTCRLKNGGEVPSVFRVDTNTGGSLQSVFWRIADRWYEHQDADALDRMGLDRAAVFPFDWTYRTKLRKDIYHD